MRPEDIESQLKNERSEMDVERERVAGGGKDRVRGDNYRENATFLSSFRFLAKARATNREPKEKLPRDVVVSLFFIPFLFVIYSRRI